MARPERNNVDYFPHPVTHGRKMFYLRSKYKNDGYTVWFKLLEELGKADYHYLDLKDETQLMYLSSEFLVSENILIEIIESLVKFGEFDLNLWNEKIVFSQKFIESIEDAYLRRNNNVLHKQDLCTTLIQKGRLKKVFLSVKNNNKPQSKVEDSKEDKSKKEIYREFKHLKITQIEFEKLLELKYTKQQIDSILDDIENFANNKKYTSLYLTARNWLKNNKSKEPKSIYNKWN